MLYSDLLRQIVRLPLSAEVKKMSGLVFKKFFLQKTERQLQRYSVFDKCSKLHPNRSGHSCVIVHTVSKTRMLGNRI